VLIAYRLWTRQATLRDSRKAFGLTREAGIMAESGAIYSITLILIIATYVSKSNSFNVFLDMVSGELIPPPRFDVIADSRIIKASPIIGIAVSDSPSEIDRPSRAKKTHLFF